MASRRFTVEQVLDALAIDVRARHDWKLPRSESIQRVIPVDGYAPNVLAQNRNSKTHWSEKAEVIEDFEGRAKAMALAYCGGPNRPDWPAIVSVYSFVGLGRHTQDLLNEGACYKPHFDGFTLAGVWSDDSVVCDVSYKHIKLPTRIGRMFQPLDGVAVFAIEQAEQFDELMPEILQGAVERLLAS